jgi:hypothetical protein
VTQAYVTEDNMNPVGCFLGCCVVWYGRSLLTFQRCLLPPSSGRWHIWNVGKQLPDYTAQQPRTQPSSYSPPWEPQISQYESRFFPSSRQWQRNIYNCIISVWNYLVRIRNFRISHNIYPKHIPHSVWSLLELTARYVIVQIPGTHLCGNNYLCSQIQSMPCLATYSACVITDPELRFYRPFKLPSLELYLCLSPKKKLGSCNCLRWSERH